jgi:hypothetical protein
MMGVRARSAPPTAPEQGDEVIIELENHHARQRRRMLVSFVLLVIVGIALYVRLIHLTALGFNSDEAVYTGQAGAPGRGGRLRTELFAVPRAPAPAPDDPRDGVHDPRPHERVHVAGDRRRHGRRAAVFSTYLLGRRMFGLAAGLGAALALAVMPYHVLISRQVLLDVPAGLAILLAFAACTDTTARPRDGGCTSRPRLLGSPA